MNQNMQADHFFLPAELVAQALASLAEQCHDEIDRLDRQPHQGAPDIKSEKVFFLRQYRAFIKAAYHWGRGVRPVLSASGSWLVPSGSRAGQIYEVTKHGGVWQCGPDCAGRDFFHWHTALIAGLDRAMELAEQQDDGDPGPGEPPTDDATDDPYLPDADDLAAAQQLGRRIARAAAARWSEELYAA